MANYFKLLKGNQAATLDKILFFVGGAAHLLPAMLEPVTSFALGPVTVQMLVGALMVAMVSTW